MKQNTKRLDYLDACKGIGIIFIVFCHVMEETNTLTVYMSTYKITIFYIVIGILAAYKGRETFDINKRAKSLLLPYLLFSILTIISELSICILLHHGEDALLYLSRNIAMTISLRGISTLWFLPSLFFGEWIFYKSFHRLHMQLLIGISPIAVIIISNVFMFGDNIISYLLLVLLKSILASWFIGVGFFGYMLLKHCRWPLIMTGALGIILWGANIYLSPLTTDLDFNHLYFGRIPIMFFVTGVAGAWGVILCFCFISSYRFAKILKSIFNTLCYFGKNSLIIMLTHMPFPLIIAMFRVWNLCVKVPYYIQCILVFISIFFIEYFLIEIINSYFPETIGKHSEKSIIRKLKRNGAQ